MTFIGRHTTLSYLQDQPRIWKRIPYLRDNHCKAPPIILAVGDRRRVYAATKHLTDPVPVPALAARLVRPHNPRLTPVLGRVFMVIGMAGKVPVMVVETQMGAPATQIIMEEILSDQITTTAYKTAAGTLTVPQKVVIRAGTAGAINCPAKPPLRVGDLSIATHTIGATGATIQALTALDMWHPDTIRRFRRDWQRLGPDFTVTPEGDPRADSTHRVVKALEQAAKQLSPGRYQLGGNVTKDSLYSEQSASLFQHLCRTQNCRSTEMEFTTLAATAAQHNAAYGMINSILSIIGVEESWISSEKRVAAIEDRTIRVALQAAQQLAEEKS